MVNQVVHYFTLLLHSGFHGKAIRVLQAWTEYHFFPPPHLDGQFGPNDKRKEFAEFWTGGNKRIGERDATGRIGWVSVKSKYNFRLEQQEARRLHRH